MNARPTLFPWSILPRFLLLRFAGIFLFVAFTLTSLLVVFDLLAHADDLSLHHESTFLPMLCYAGLRLPTLLTMITPMSVLLAALITFERLASQYELAALQSAGISLYQVCFALLLGGIGIGAAHYYIAATLAKPAEARLFRWAERNYQGLPGRPVLEPGPAWFGTARYRVHVANAREHGRQLDDVIVVENAKAGVMTTYFEAKDARYDGSQWTLFDGWEQPIEGGLRKPFQQRTLDLQLIPEQVAQVRLPLSSLGLDTLRVLRLKSADDEIRPERYDTWIGRRRAEPLASLVMILLSAPLGLQLRRGGRQLRWGGIAMGLGFLFFITERVLLAFGDSGDLTPGVAVWGPFAAFALIAAALLLFQQK